MPNYSDFDGACHDRGKAWKGTALLNTAFIFW